jgi:hypothetical protein
MNEKGAKSKKMCSICNISFPDFTIEHSEINCPFRNSRYCSYCASYGHLTKSCPAKPLKKFREPCYVEQLIPLSVLEEKNITSKTVINYKEEPQRILFIKDNKKQIKEYLKSVSFKMSCNTEKEAKQAIEEYAKQTNQRVVYQL